ncbi:MAG TPA: hypothetical protein VHL59_17045 [Thermoanaerobaculia bacterium]|nr:hypothetical protein [Thermoanaerobaculia bacterium]
MKKGLFALVVLAMICAAAPEAAADHCYRCYNSTNCGPSTGYGRQFCEDYTGSCVFYGYACDGPHPFIETEEPLAAAFVVASVERLDEPKQPADGEVRVASLEMEQKTAHR